MTEPRSAAPRPRSVLVADDHLYREIAQSPEHVALLEDPEAMVVPYSARPEGNEIEVMAIRDLLVASDQLVSGALLVKDPYENDRYAFADDAVESFASAKSKKAQVLSLIRVKIRSDMATGLFLRITTLHHLSKISVHILAIVTLHHRFQDDVFATEL